MKNRRDFLKLLGMAAGASLTGCGGSGGGTLGNGGLTPLANAYHFLPLASAGASLPNSESIMAQASTEGDLPFMGGVMLNDRRHVCFHATNANGKHGVFEVDYEPGGQVDPIKHLISEGDVLPDGTLVDDVSGGYLNNDNDVVFVVSSESGETLQYSTGGAPFQRYFDEYDDVSPQCRLYGDLRPEVGLTDNDDLLFVCGYRDEEDRAMGEGLFCLPQGNASETILLLGEDQLLPGSSCGIRTFGLCQIGSTGEYLVQGTAAPVETQANTDDDGNPLSFLARGKVGESPEVLVAHPALGISQAIQGSVDMGPRLGPDGYAFIVSTGLDRSQLYLNQTKLLDAGPGDSGSLTPRGARIVSMFPPVFGPNGLMFIQVFTTVGTEILAYSGSGFSSILGRGDSVQGKQVEMIVFGALPCCVNSFSELVTVVEYSSGESAILLGIPV